jgi:hypothetical protein
MPGRRSLELATNKNLYYLRFAGAFVLRYPAIGLDLRGDKEKETKNRVNR